MLPVTMSVVGNFKLFTLEFAFSAVCLDFVRQAFTLLNHRNSSTNNIF
ncbi:MAG: hypothetical protein LBP59_02395 [Planctomycetaceae bacterium]|nr:hypothetical protein [Planctomycetaceae bacterium]